MHNWFWTSCVSSIYSVDFFPRFSWWLSSALSSAHVLWWPTLQTVWTQIRLLLRSSLIRVHNVCFCDKISLECIWIYAAYVISRLHFLDPKKGNSLAYLAPLSYWLYQCAHPFLFSRQFKYIITIIACIENDWSWSEGFFRSCLVWICTVYPGSTGLGFKWI